MSGEYLKGAKAWRGEKLLAGTMFFPPRLRPPGRAASAPFAAAPERLEENVAISLAEALGVRRYRRGATPPGSAAGRSNGVDH
eukprot:5747974-Pyramimonas_sp.AAC.1